MTTASAIRPSMRGVWVPAVVIRDACRAIDLNGSVESIEKQFAESGVTLIESTAVTDQ